MSIIRNGELGGGILEFLFVIIDFFYDELLREQMGFLENKNKRKNLYLLFVEWWLGFWVIGGCF